MKYKEGDRVLYNRQKFGTVPYNQFNQTEVDVIFDREKNKIVAVRTDRLELVADAQHEATLSTLINTPVKLTDGQHTKVFAGVPTDLAAELIKLAGELEEGAELDTNMLRVRTNMKSVASRLRDIAEGK